MKTVFINCSPKKRVCASAYFLELQRLFVKGKKVTERLRVFQNFCERSNLE